jgi:hypothetical protein
LSRSNVARGLIVTHYDPGVRAADEIATISRFDPDAAQGRGSLRGCDRGDNPDPGIGHQSTCSKKIVDENARLDNEPNLDTRSP